ncbi:hypothetical protein GGX14DRAFT_411745 [Mycena pura]|uniref:Wings apart-like protein C-terminal domain-containing protein n=1 Tax=Mycena pura TaxID=153505 RepID=A0AAD7E652_9AGAR|nr:hypothetical protein GGX14DRAFT_411745 [Mycena pura]
MPSTSLNSRTYSRSSVKRKSEGVKKSSPEAKRRRFDSEDEGDVSTDVETDQAAAQHHLPPRDLSQIFEVVNTSSNPSTSPTKLAKRMLSRSRTESSIASGSGTGSSYSSISSVITRTTSLPTAQEGRGLPAKPQSPEAKQCPIPRVKISGRTYAGASRSFLVPIPVNSGSLEQLQEELDDEFASRESYTSLRTRWGVDESEDDPYVYGSPARSGSNFSTPNASPSKGGKGKGKSIPEPVPLPNGMMNPLKSITELRNRGESRRFLDEVGYLWEGLDKSVGLKLRRASALEINVKLCEPDFARKAKTADFIGQTWDLLREGGAGKGEDKILDILLAFFCALVSRDSSSISDLAQRSSAFSSTLFSLLANFSPTTDPLACVSDATQLRKLGISKKDQSLLSSIHAAINSSLFPHSTGLSTALLLSHTLATLPSAFLDPSRPNIRALLTTLRSHVWPLMASPLSTFIATSHNDPRIAFTHVHNVLSLFDSYLLGGWSSQAEADLAVTQQELEDARDAWFADGLLAFGIYTEVINSRRTIATSRQDKDKTRSCALVTLRLLVGLTHSDKNWCAKLTKHDRCFGFILRTVLRGHSERLEKVNARPKSEGNIKREEPTIHPAGSHNEKESGNVKRENDEVSGDCSTNGDDERTDQALDTLCLALGLLTNLIQVDDGAKSTLRETYVSSHCAPSKCFETCGCAKRTTALEALVNVYKQLLSTTPSPDVKSEPSPEPTDPVALIAAGETRLLLSHLSLLFGLLMIDNTENQRVIIDLLPFPTLSSQYKGDSGKVNMLIGHAREFAYIYFEGDDGAEEGENVRNVLRFLEALREM